MRIVKKLINRIRHGSGVAARRPSVPADVDPPATAMIEFVRDYTMTSPERLYGLYKAVEYVVAAGIAGDVVECGVWRGGSSMLAAKALLHFGQDHRHLHLFDTFDGMTAPSTHDVDLNGVDAESVMRLHNREDEASSIWCYSPLEKVQQAMSSTGYPNTRIHFVKGRVEDTIPQAAPQKIAILRLDTDWYESTRHELEHLFPRLVVGGVLIIDDYGHWQGARKAVDEYLSASTRKVLLNRIDYTGRMGVVAA